MDNGTLGFMARLKRHHIFRVASIYSIAAWVLMQLANSIFPSLGWPRQSVLVLIVALALLFPVVLVLGWMLIPPSREDPDKFSQWQHLRWRLGSALTVVIVGLVVISGALLSRAHAHYLQADVVSNAAQAISPAVTIPAKSDAGKAVGALDKLLASGNGGDLESVAMLKLDPIWDSIRNDPRFQALLTQYAQYKPAITYDAPPAAATSS